MTLKAIIFDVDGTMAETEEVHRQAFNNAFAHFRLGWRWDRKTYGELLRVTGGKERIRHFAKLRIDDKTISAIHAEKTKRYTALVESGRVPLRPGIENLIFEAKEAGIRLAIATTTTPANVTALLNATLGPSAERLFEVIAAGDCVTAKKPAPDVYLQTLHSLNLAPHDCLAVEDSANGLKAALAAGIPTIVTRSVYTQDDDFTGATKVMDELHADLSGLAQVREDSELRTLISEGLKSGISGKSVNDIWAQAATTVSD